MNYDCCQSDQCIRYGTRIVELTQTGGMAKILYNENYG